MNGLPFMPPMPAVPPVERIPKQPSRALEPVNSAPELERRRQADRSRGRLLAGATACTLLFAALGVQLVRATVLEPTRPRARIAPRVQVTEAGPQVRAPITDRNGETLAASLRGTSLVADPKEIGSARAAAEIAARLKTVFPDLDLAAVTTRLTPHQIYSEERERWEDARFVYIRHDITDEQREKVLAAGAWGVEFRTAERRIYPQGRNAVHVLGQVVDLEARGIAGVEQTFNRQLTVERQPLQLSIDIRVQLALRTAVSRAMTDFNGVAGAAVMMDIHSGEILGLVSLPDYDPSDRGTVRRCGPEYNEANRISNLCETYNRVVSGRYEPGSTMKLLTAAMALESGTASLASSFDAAHPLKFGRFTITDYKGQNRWLTFAEVIQHSSNLGAAHMAMGVGPQRHRDFLGRMGMLTPVGVELPGRQAPGAPPASRWSTISTATIGFGHGIAVTPLHIITAVTALTNGGTLRQPTLVAQAPGEAPRTGERVVSERTSDTIRRLMRLVVTDGSGKRADAPGYFLGGKTGTADKTDGHGHYLRNRRVAAFVGAFPMQRPRYAIYVMVDDPRPNAQSAGYATAGWVVAPAVREAVSVTAPLLGLVPETERAAQIQSIMAFPPQVARPGAARPAAGPAAAQRAQAPAAAPAPAQARPAAPMPGLPAPPALRRADVAGGMRLVAAPEVPIAPQ